MEMRKIFILTIIIGIISACTDGKIDRNIKNIEITIDWLPTQEYFGIYYAKHSGIFKRYGYNVTIKSGTSAADVATQIGVGSIAIGTTTSDSVLRRYAEGQHFSALRKIFNFNPASMITLQNKNIHKLADLYGKTLGVNIQANPYEQFTYVIENDRNIPLQAGQFKEYPIDFGGPEQLLAGNVDTFLGYTTNHAIDVSLRRPDMQEIFFGDLGVYSYGLVLAFADVQTLARHNLNNEDIDKIYNAVAEGYNKGLQDMDKAVEYLMENSPTLTKEKIQAGIAKIGKLNQSVVYPHYQIDQWVNGANGTRIAEPVREEVLKLYN
jgi:NitT/TauT family transport system substrate-binding protein